MATIEHRALVIGIDDYPYVKANPLRGCVNDARRIAGVLRDRFRLRVRLLLDREATRQAIVEQLDDLLHSARPAQRIVVHFSGHGSRIAAGRGASTETLVPYDSGRGAWPNRDITDQEIYRWLTQVTELTPLVTLIFDSCHSGGIVRDLEARARGLPADRRPQALDGKDAFATGIRAVDGRGARGGSGWLPLSDRYTLFAACAAEERAREIVDPATGRTHGVMTCFLAEALGTAGGDVSCRELFERVGPRVTARFQAQHPQLEGAWDRQLFGRRLLTTMPFAPILERHGGRVRLGAGAAHGVVLGSEWECLPAATRRRRGAQVLGRLRVEDTEPGECGASLVEEVSAGAVVAGTRAVEVARPAQVRRLRVRLAAGSPRLAAAVEGSIHLRVVREGEDFDFVVHRLEARRRVHDGAPVPQLGALAIPTWSVVDGTSRQVMPPIDATWAGAVERLVADLELWARHRALIELSNPDSASCLAHLLRVELLRCPPGGSWHAATAAGGDPLPLFEEGDRLGLRLRHDHDAPLHVAVLDLGLTGAVTLLHPPRGAVRPIPPATEVEIGVEDGDPIQLFVPDELPYPGEETSSWAEMVAVFATTRATDLGLLTQPGTGGRLAAADELADAGLPATASSPLGILLRLALSGAPQRDAAKTPLGSPDRWAVVKRSFVLRRGASRAPALPTRFGDLP